MRHSISMVAPVLNQPITHLRFLNFVRIAIVLMPLMTAECTEYVPPLAVPAYQPPPTIHLVPSVPAVDATNPAAEAAKNIGEGIAATYIYDRLKSKQTRAAAAEVEVEPRMVRAAAAGETLAETEGAGTLITMGRAIAAEPIAVAVAVGLGGYTIYEVWRYFYPADKNAVNGSTPLAGRAP